MKPEPKEPRSARQIIAIVQRRIAAEGARIWRLQDFADLPPSAVAQALSRLARRGKLERISKGVYYSSRPSRFGKTRPHPAAMQELASDQKALFPSGIAAANLLGFTTQAPSKHEIATNAPSVPRKLLDSDTVVHTRRPEAWLSLSNQDAALLDFLRRAGRTSELSPRDTVRRLLTLFAEEDRFERLLKVIRTEPPRVRAMIGDIGEELGKPPATLEDLRKSLNPISRFDFGTLSDLPTARRWHAKGLTE